MRLFFFFLVIRVEGSKYALRVVDGEHERRVTVARQDVAHDQRTGAVIALDEQFRLAQHPDIDAGRAKLAPSLACISYHSMMSRMPPFVLLVEMLLRLRRDVARPQRASAGRPRTARSRSAPGIGAGLRPRTGRPCGRAGRPRRHSRRACSPRSRHPCDHAGSCRIALMRGNCACTSRRDASIAPRSRIAPARRVRCGSPGPVASDAASSEIGVHLG